MGNSPRSFSNLPGLSEPGMRNAWALYPALSPRTPSRNYRLALALALFWVHVIGAPMLLGGVYAWAMVAIACSALLCLLAAAIARPKLRAGTPAVIWISLILLGWTVLQAAPLPCALVRIVAAGSAATTVAAQAVLSPSAAAWCSLSYDPGATQQEVVKGIALVATLLTSWILSAGSARRDVLWMVAASALAMSCVALAHAIVQAEAVFGIYKPVEARPPLLLAPLLNANTLGGFVALGVPLWIGLTHRHRRSEMRWFGRIATVITAVAAILSLSRGAIAEVVGTFLFMAGYIQVRSRRSRRSARRPTAALVVIGTGALAVALVAYVAGAAVADQFAHADLSKLSLLARAFAFAAEHPWIGVGRGAFSTAFLSVAGREVRFEYAENFVAQWASEWGAPFTLLWIGAVLVALVRRLRAARSLASVGAATALVGFSAQNLVDLGFELLGVATVAIALFGAVLSPTQLRSGVSQVGMRACIALALAAGAAGLIVFGPHLQEGSVPALEKSLRTSLAEGRRSAFRTTLQRAVTLHPAEPLFPIFAATEALRHDDPSTPRWLNRAMQVAPRWGAPHVLAFQWLWGRGHRSQALLELERAAELDRSAELLESLCRVARLNGELALVAIPRGQHRREVFEMAGNCVPREARSSAVIDRALLQEFPDSPAALERSAYRVARGGEIEAALAILGKLLDKSPDWDSARLTRVAVLQSAERYDEVARQVTRDLAALTPVPPIQVRSQLLRAQADAFARQRDLEGMRRSLDAFRRLAGSSARELAEAYALEGSLQLLLENFGAALSAFHEAYRINNETQYLTAVASTARQIGNRSQELWAYMQLCSREPVGTTYCAERDRLLAPAPRL